MKTYLDKFKTVYCLGDCYTAGQDFERQYGYPYFLQLLLGEGYFVENLGRANIQMHSMLDYPSLFIPDNPAYQSAAFLWCGSNDIYLNLIDDDAIFIKYAELTELLEKKDLQVFHLTMSKRYNVPLLGNQGLEPYEIFEKRRKIFNKRLIDKYAGNVIDIVGELFFPKYFKEDREHLTYDGHKRVGKVCFEFLKKKGF